MNAPTHDEERLHGYATLLASGPMPRDLPDFIVRALAQGYLTQSLELMLLRRRIRELERTP